jgi:hypothetical protein
MVEMNLGARGSWCTQGRFFDLVEVVRFDTLSGFREKLESLEWFSLIHKLLIYALEDCFRMCKMTLNLIENGKFEGAFNFDPWKLKLRLLLEEVYLCEHVEKVIPKPIAPTKLATYQKKEANVKMIIIDLVKEHFISHIVEEDTCKGHVWRFD